MAYTTISKSSDYFRTKLYTGNETARSITFDESANMQPDLMWVKSRGHTASWLVNDAVRGATKRLKLDMNSAESTQAAMITAFNTNGFSLGTSTTANQNSTNFIAYNWKANGAGSSNSDGNITSTVSANTTAGFSIVKYSGNSGGNGYSATIGHGLGTAPSMVVVKCITNSDGWFTYHKGNTSAPQTDFLRLDNTDATADLAGMWYDTAPTSSVFTVGTDGGVNQVGRDYIAYCFAEKTGYSKFGSYTGNGNANGTFIYTGFKPSFIIAKKTNSTGNWVIVDTKRDGYNGANDTLSTNATDTESGGNRFDIYSNGFKARSTSSYSNSSGDTFIYIAFAEAPLVGSNNVPCTAR